MNVMTYRSDGQIDFSMLSAQSHPYGNDPDATGRKLGNEITRTWHDIKLGLAVSSSNLERYRIFTCGWSKEHEVTVRAMSQLTSPYNASSSLDLSTLRESRIDTVLGPLYISVMLFSMLYGVLTVQVVLYYQRCKKDRLFLRCTIIGLWLLDTGLFGVVIFSGWYAFVTEPVSFLATGHMPWTAGLWYIVIGVNETVVCSIMMWMAWTLSGKKKWLYVVMIIPAMAAFAGFIGYSVISFRNPTAIAEKSNSWTWYLPFAGHAFVDIIICIALTTSLIKMHTGLRKSDFVVRLLVVWFLNSGFLASALTVLAIILYAVNPESTACKTVASILSQVALNSLLGLLNTREYRMKMLQNQGTNDELPISTVVVPTSIHFASMPLSAGSTNASIWSQSSGEHYMGNIGSASEEDKVRSA